MNTIEAYGILNNKLIAIDGTSGSGKGAISIGLSKKLNFIYLDTGLLYRKYANLILTHEIEFADTVSSQQLNAISDDLSELRNDDHSALASKVATNLFVRLYLKEIQQQIIFENLQHNNGLIVDGRDIATEICPWARCKIFVDADINVRAQRRYDQLIESGKVDTALEEVIENLKKRDHQDKTRECAPLKFTDDYFYIDTTNITLEESIQIAFNEVKQKLKIV